MCGINKGKGRQGVRKCPVCDGEKIIVGICSCDMEWRGTQEGSEWSDCQCTPSEKCPTCDGTGVVGD